MGKVGSATVVRSLKNGNLPNPIFHIHFLTNDSISFAEEYHHKKSSDNLPPHIKISKALRAKMITERHIKWKIITIVREPIGWGISEFFENIHSYYNDLLNKDGRIIKDDAIRFIKNRLTAKYNEETDYVCTWFDKEIGKAFNIDVYSHPFDHKLGFSIVRNGNCELLILRLENLDENFNRAVKLFLNSDRSFKIFKNNIGIEKEHSNSYKFVADNMRISKDACIKVYSSKFVKHFYDINMINTFINKWSE
jgi:hypothetical protein